MPFLLFVLIVILIAQIGFWDTLGAIFGAVGVVVLFVVILAAVVALAGWLAVQRMRGPGPRP